ncbi:hypothetical protein [Thalassobacillus sp. C254]|uniref:hypothetical protein n=1 Tax=Thalassobacillus sp. C254 TaxID=1225341 RepID=UPI0022B73D39|nr:hypothetical protein [Thalassobacillus sp. C254]
MKHDLVLARFFLKDKKVYNLTIASLQGDTFRGQGFSYLREHRPAGSSALAIP